MCVYPWTLEEPLAPPPRSGLGVSALGTPGAVVSTALLSSTLAPAPAPTVPHLTSPLFHPSPVSFPSLSPTPPRPSTSRSHPIFPFLSFPFRLLRLNSAPKNASTVFFEREKAVDVFLYLSLSLSLCLSTYICLSVCLPISVSLSICISFCICPSIYLPISVSLHLSTSPSLHLSIPPPLHPSTSPSLHLSTSPYLSTHHTYAGCEIRTRPLSLAGFWDTRRIRMRGAVRT